MFFSPVCFLPWRAAWPEVVKVSVQEKREACGQGYFFLDMGVLLLGRLEDEEAFEVVMGVVGSVLMAGADVMGGRVAVVLFVCADEGV